VGFRVERFSVSFLTVGFRVYGVKALEMVRSQQAQQDRDGPAGPFMPYTGGLSRISAGCDDFLFYWWASEYEIVGFRVSKSGPSRSDQWASVSEKVGFRVTLYKEARGT
jgi:hypothetical protein